MNPRIVFLDVDGTLINYHTIMPQSAGRAVTQAMKNGHRVYLCTGDSRYELGHRKLMETDGLILGNGVYVEDHGNVILHQTISAQDERAIVDWCSERQLGYVLECNSGMYCNSWMKKKGPDAMYRYGTGKGKDPEAARQSASGYVGIMQEVHGNDQYRDDVNKISFVLDHYQDHLDSKAMFPDLVAGTWGGKDEMALFGDLSPKGISKKHGIQVLLDYLKASREDTIAFGDAKIDIPMFEACAYSVAMGNAGEECKAAADYVTDDVDNDGLAKAFRHLGLID